jgi:serine/threonine protein kinase
MEFMGGGDLASVLEEWTYFDEFIVRFYITEMILATHHLHMQNIIHRDLKPENLLLDNLGHLKLTDFGLAQFLNRKYKTKFNKRNKFKV